MTPTAPLLRVLSLGAGVQSSTLLLMAVTGEVDKLDAAIFADTGWEPQAVYRHLAWLEEQAKAAGIPVYRVSAGNIRDDVLASKEGKRFAPLPLFVGGEKSEGRLWRQCTRDYKIIPITRKLRDLLGVPRGRAVRGQTIEQWFGISLDEVQRLRTPRDAWITNRYPLVDARMTRADCLLWLERHHYPTPPKSACIGCPYHNNAYWRDMQRQRPDEWADAIGFDRAIRHGLRGVRSEAYLHRSLQPLDEVDLRNAQDRGQVDLFGEECGGLCGV